MTDTQQPERRDRDPSENVYSAEDVSQGEIILRTPLRKAIFFGGLVLAIVAGFVLSGLSGHLPTMH